MSSITSGIGLVSGLPIQQLVDSLIQLQSRPILQLQDRLGLLVARRTAFLQLSAELLSIKNKSARFDDSSFFQSARAVSSNESVLLASADSGADPGQTTLTVRNLATTHHLVSSGFADSDNARVGRGTLTFESAAALLNSPTELTRLNGGAGVQAGRIRITDRTGNSAVVDLVSAQTVDDVVRAINSATGIDVQAATEANGLVLQDLSGGAGDLAVSEVGLGRTAVDLGIFKSVSGDRLEGDSVMRISGETRLSRLNDGNGIRTLRGREDFSITLSDGSPALGFNLSPELRPDMPLALLNGGTGIPDGTIRITDRSGSSAEITLAGATTVQDVLDAINSADGIDVTASINHARLVVTDNSLAEGQTAQNDLLIEDVDGAAAEALGLVDSANDDRIDGRDIYFVAGLDDVLRIINLHPDNGGRLEAAISDDGLGITLFDKTSGSGEFAVSAINGSNAAEDLGLLSPASNGAITSRRLVANLNSVLLRSLNGGQGVDLSELSITDRAGNSFDFSANGALTGLASLDDLVRVINEAPVSITASISPSGLGIRLQDTSGGAGNLIVAGATADDLGLAIDDAVDEITNGNLQRQYISAATRFEDFNGGKGIPRGKFRITDSSGQSAVVDLTQGDETTLQDVINEINSRPTAIEARINDAGDGLLLIDTAGGNGLLEVEEDGGTTAKSLGILGQAAEGETVLDGSFETRVEVDANDTLDDVASKIRNSGAEVNATILNDGSSGRSFRLSLTSVRSGRNGRLAIDAGGTKLSFNTVAEPKDALVILGDPTADAPIVITASSNTLTDVLKGVRLDLVAASNDPITVSVERDADAIVEGLRGFVDDFNRIIDSLDQLTRFDSETEARGILQGDSTARRIRQILLGLPTQTISGLPTSMNRLGSIGIRLESGANLSFDEDKLRQALADDPDAVSELFAHKKTDAEGVVQSAGLAGIIGTAIDRLTEADNGVISLREEALQASENGLNRRIDQLELLLDRRRDRLFAQFNAMEAVIAGLQSQQSALSALAGPAAPVGL